MKIFIAIFLLFIGFVSHSQNIFFYTDTVNHFSIGIPTGWNYQGLQTAGPGVKLIVTRPKDKDSNIFVENYNINIVSFPNSNIESAYSDLKANISKRKGYEFESELDTSINGIKYKWHLEKHSNSLTSQPMMALIILGYKNNNGYMLTLVTTEDSFTKYKILFRKIASTFNL